MLHLAIFSPGEIQKIFTGKKTIDGRFSQIRCMPYKSIEKGDLVLMKKSGGKVYGYFVAGDIKFYEGLDNKQLEKIIKLYKDELSLNESFWHKKKNRTKYLTLIEIKKPTKFRFPVTVKKRNLSGWISLGGQSQSQIELF